MAEASTLSMRASRESVESVSRLPVGVGGGAEAAGTGADPEVGLGDWMVTLTVGAFRSRAPQPPQLRKPSSSAVPVTAAPQRGHLGDPATFTCESVPRREPHDAGNRKKDGDLEKAWEESQLEAYSQNDLQLTKRFSKPLQ